MHTHAGTRAQERLLRVHGRRRLLDARLARTLRARLERLRNRGAARVRSAISRTSVGIPAPRPGLRWVPRGAGSLRAHGGLLERRAAVGLPHGRFALPAGVGAAGCLAGGEDARAGSPDALPRGGARRVRGQSGHAQRARTRSSRGAARRLSVCGRRSPRNNGNGRPTARARRRPAAGPRRRQQGVGAPGHSTRTARIAPRSPSARAGGERCLRRHRARTTPARLLGRLHHRHTGARPAGHRDLPAMAGVVVHRYSRRARARPLRSSQARLQDWARLDRHDQPSADPRLRTRCRRPFVAALPWPAAVGAPGAARVGARAADALPARHLGCGLLPVAFHSCAAGVRDTSGDAHSRHCWRSQPAPSPG